MSGVVAFPKELSPSSFQSVVPQHPTAWRERVRYVSNASLLPVSPNFLLRETPTAAMSQARRQGHATLEPLVETGLGLSWDAWQTEVRAYIRSEQYQIHGALATDVMAQYDDVEIHLGRAPITAAEYHEKRHTLNVLERQRLEGAIALSAASLKQVSQELASAKARLGESQDELKRQSLAHEAELQALTQRLADLEAREIASPADMAQFREQALAMLQAHLDDVGQQSINGILRLVDELPKSRDGAVAASLRNQLADLSQRHTEKEQALGHALLTITEKDSLISTLEQQIAKLVEDVSLLTSQVAMLDLGAVPSASALAALQAEVATLQQRCTKLGDGNKKLRHLTERQRLRLRVLNEKLALAQSKAVAPATPARPSVLKRIMRAITE